MRKTAVVMGGSMAGALTAGVLSATYERVILLEKDANTSDPTPRRGVPQSGQGHVLLDRGRTVIESLFPGIFAEICEAGSVDVNMGRDLRWFQHGAWRVRHDSAWSFISQSRPFLEMHILRRLRQLTNVQLRHEEPVDAPIFDGGRVVGVRLRSGEQIHADLTVDAMGRASKARKWLAGWGFDAPPEQSVSIKLGYASRIVRPMRAERDWRCMIVYPSPPSQRRLGYIFPVEDGLWQISLGGYHGDHPPTDDDGFAAFAASLPVPELSQALREAEVVTDTVRHLYPKQRRIGYHKMSRFPEGFGIIGDSVCSVDPVFGQGMTLAARGAQALADHVANGGTGGKALQKAVAREADVAWLLTSSEAHRFPQTTGHTPSIGPIMRWYMRRVFQHASVDEAVYEAFLEVMHMESGPEALFRPKVIARVLGALPA